MITRFFDGSEKYIYPNEEEYTFYEDGTILSSNKDKVSILEYPTGAKEVNYPDGTIVKVNPDGTIDIEADDSDV